MQLLVSGDQHGVLLWCSPLHGVLCDVPEQSRPSRQSSLPILQEGSIFCAGELTVAPDMQQHYAITHVRTPASLANCPMYLLTPAC